MKPIQKDSIWDSVRIEAKIEADKEPLLASFLHATILNHTTLENALGFILASKLASNTLTHTTSTQLGEVPSCKRHATNNRYVTIVPCTANVR